MRRIAGAHQQGGVINKDGCVIGLKPQGAVEIAASLIDIAVLEFKFAGNKVSGGAQLGVALALEFRQSVRVNFALLNNCLGQVAFVRKTVNRDENREIAAGFGGARWRRGGHAAGFDVVYRILGNGIAVVADVVLVVRAIFADVVRYDGASVLQMDRVS